MATLVLLSGGLDSTTLLWHTRATHALTVDYGQTNDVERDAARALASLRGVRHREIDLRPLGTLMASALTGHGSIEDGPYDEGRPGTLVPNRNAVFIAAACAWASSEGVEEVATAVHSDDTVIYTDTTPEFIEKMDIAMRESCGVRVTAPFARWRKTDIVSRAVELGVPLGRTWTCYRGVPPHCGRCAACLDRRRAFREANCPDPTTYQE